MIPENMLLFLTAENIKNHKEYMNTLFAKYMIYEKSISALKGKTPREISKMRLNREDKFKILSLLTEYLSHKSYFSSFAENNTRCPEIKKYFTSEDDFCYRVIECAKKETGGFVYIINDRNGTPCILHSSECTDIFINYTPVLALDLCEHAYFADYGYDKEEYIRRAAARLDISKLFPKVLT